MKKSVFLFVCLFLTGIAAESVKAQNSATATANAAATIVTPITIKKNVDLNFGAIVPSGTEKGTVTIETTGSRTSTGGVTLIGGTYSAAAFRVTGEADAPFSVTLPDKVSLTNSNGKEMKVHSFSHSASPTPKIASGETSFNVGATIDVSGRQPAGVYNGSFDVTVSYQ